MSKFFLADPVSFLDDEINTIPLSAVPITDEVWQSLLQAQSEGKSIQADKKGKPIAVSRLSLSSKQILDSYLKSASFGLDKVAKEWGYDSFLSAISYVTSTNPQFKAEAKALISWRDSYWDKAYRVKEKSLPSDLQSFLDLLPIPPTKPTE